ncbi:MAG TPA: hypothetical protein VFE58_15075 [Tepidisphaeraceae bacterium]|nr:hypothetical protein [Tepidisphaeraceae bacterium]
MSLLLSVVMGMSAGCASPNKANIELRKENATLAKQITRMQREHDVDDATIRGMRDRVGVLPTLPKERLAKLFTVGAIKVTRLTGGFDLNHERGADTGVRAYVQLFDTTGDLIKAAGTFEVEVFDLADDEHPLVGKKTFPVEQADTNWYPMPMIYSFVLPVPWITPPKHNELTVRVKYTDELTQRQFTAEAVIHVTLPALTK